MPSLCSVDQRHAVIFDMYVVPLLFMGLPHVVGHNCRVFPTVGRFPQGLEGTSHHSVLSQQRN